MTTQLSSSQLFPNDWTIHECAIFSLKLLQMIQKLLGNEKFSAHHSRWLNHLERKWLHNFEMPAITIEVKLAHDYWCKSKTIPLDLASLFWGIHRDSIAALWRPYENIMWGVHLRTIGYSQIWLVMCQRKPSCPIVLSITLDVICCNVGGYCFVAMTITWRAIQFVVAQRQHTNKSRYAIDLGEA